MLPLSHVQYIRPFSSELASVPEDLRSVLEACLSEDATPDNLEIYLPEVRKIITSLLQGLRGKQSIYRRIVSDQKRSEGGSDRDSRASRSDRPRGDDRDSVRQPSRGPTPSNDGLPSRSKTPSGSSRRKPSSSENVLPPAMPNGSEPFIGGFAPPGASVDPDLRPSRSSTPMQARPSFTQSGSFQAPRAYSTSSADPNFPRDPRSQTNGFGTPPPPDQPLPPPPPTQAPVPKHVKRFSLVDAPVPPPPSVVVNDGTPPSAAPSDGNTPPTSPPAENLPLDQSAPAVQTSLAALKKAEALERRASKRFSTYNISKMTGGGSTRGGGGAGGNRRSLLAANGMLTPAELAALAEEGDNASPRKKGGKSGRPRGPSPIVEGEEPPPVPPLPQTKSPSPQPQPPPDKDKDEDKPAEAARVSTAESESSGPPTGPFPVFLQVGREVKKVVIEPGMSLATLRVLFVDKFSYSPGQDNFPAIYIRDPSSGVQYELEDVDEVKEKVLLSLNIERE